MSVACVEKDDPKLLCYRHDTGTKTLKKIVATSRTNNKFSQKYDDIVTPKAGEKIKSETPKYRPEKYSIFFAHRYGNSPTRI